MGRTVCGAAPGARRRFTPRSLPVASLAVPLLSLLITRPAGAQLPSGAGVSPGAEQLQRQNRIDELRRIELDQRLRANQAVPPGQRILVDYGGYISASYLTLDDEVGDDHILRQYDGIAYGRVNFDGAQEFFLAGRIGYLDFHRGDSFSGRGDEPIDGDVYRGYYRFDLNRYQAAYGGSPNPDFNFTGQVGRDLVYWGNGLVMAQVIDGGVIDLQAGGLTAQFIGGVTPIRTVDIDSSRPGFDYNTRRGFYGVMLTADLNKHRPFVYWLAQRDYNEMDTGRVGFIVTKYHYDSAYLGAGSTGEITDKLRYGVEVAYQYGDTLSNSFGFNELSGALEVVNQTDDNIAAAAMNGRLDYLVGNPSDTRLSAELTMATGDEDRGHTSNTFNGNAPNTTDNAFNAFGLVNTGLAFAPDVSNIGVLRLGMSTFPFHDKRPLSRLQLGTDFFAYSKFNDDAPIDETTIPGHRFLGFEPDVYLNWQVTSDVTLAVRYGAFFPQDSAFPSDEIRQFFFAGVTFAF
jgi:hypothetical protein